MTPYDLRLPALVILFSFLQSIAAPSPTLVLETADYNQNSSVNGSLISLLQGNVVFTYDKITIRSDQATWYRHDNRILFSGTIRISMKNQLLSCDNMDFSKKEKMLVARGNVDFFDTLKQVRLLAPYARYYLQSKNLMLPENPKLYQYDTTHAETLIIVSKSMKYEDSLKIATAENDVVITKGVLRSYCALAKYNTEKKTTLLRINPVIFYDTHELTGDSIDLLFSESQLKNVSVMRNAKGLHRDFTSGDTVITRIFGDSLHLALSDSGTIETIWSFKNAILRYYSPRDSLNGNTADGKAMILHFTEGKTGNLKITGNARSVYFLENAEEKNEASGESLSIDFRQGKTVYLKFIGAVRGTYFSANMKDK